MTSSMQGMNTGGANGASPQGEQLQHAATGLLDQAARTADAQASTKMTMFGETLESVAKAIDEAAGGLRESQPELAGFADTAARKVQEASSYLRESSASEALQGVQEVARRQPAVIVGGGLLLGLALGRFLRTGATASQGQGQGAGAYGSQGYGGTAYGATGYGAGSTYGSTGTPSIADELATTDVAAHDEDMLDVETEDNFGTDGTRTTGGSR